MKVHQIQGITGTSTIMTGERLQNVETYLPSENVIILTDTNAKKYHRTHFPPGEVITIGSGEGVKNLDTVQDIYTGLLELEADRSSFILGIGGGVVCDIAGFVASTYMRGLRFGFVASTLLSQVDASVGGKNGVNFSGYKNMVGVFSQPQFVICDPNLLKTLPLCEIQCGLAEVVKHAAIADAELFVYLEQNHTRALALENEVIEKMVHASVVIKSNIVNSDETERGERRKLNFGHTFGHAIEKITGLPHGEAISIGMMLAAAVSEMKGRVTPVAVQRLEALLEKLGLPTRFEIDRPSLLSALRKDKKRNRDKINFVLLNDIGDAVVEEFDLKELESDFFERTLTMRT